MTLASDGVARGAVDKTKTYEELRARMIEETHPPLAALSWMVFVRQGMSAWLQLDDSRGIESHPRHGFAPPRIGLPAPQHSELLAVLTSLVFNLSSQKESA